jgi:predicted Zn-dependent peptidase
VSRQILVLDRPGSIQSEIRVGRPSVTAADPDHYPLLVANTIFGGAFTSRLTENIREDKGYTYSPNSSADTYQQGGLLEVTAAVRTEVTGASLLEIFYELDRMGVTDATAEEIARAKRFQSGLFVIVNQINGAVAATLSGNWVEGLPRTAIAEFVPKVNAVTAEQIRAVGKRLMTSGGQVVVIGGDAASVVPQVEQFGAATLVGEGANPQ